MRAAMTILTAALLLSSCGKPADRNAQQTQTIAVRSAEQEQLHGFNDLNRAIALKRAIYDSGYSCKRVTESGFVGQYKNLDMWMARCADGRDWAVFTGPDGSAQVRDCKDVAAIGLPECRIRQTTGAPAAG